MLESHFKLHQYLYHPFEVVAFISGGIYKTVFYAHQVNLDEDCDWQLSQQVQSPVIDWMALHYEGFFWCEVWHWNITRWTLRCHRMKNTWPNHSSWVIVFIGRVNASICWSVTSDIRNDWAPWDHWSVVGGRVTMQPVVSETESWGVGGLFICCKYTFEFKQVHHVASSAYWWAASQESSTVL